MKNNGLLNFALVASLILNITFLASAGYVSYKRNTAWISPIGKIVPQDRFLFAKLELRPRQRKALQDNAISFRADIALCRREAADAGKKLLALIRADKTDEKAIAAVIARISEKQREMQHRITEHMLAEKSLLDPEQQRKFLDLIEKSLVRCGHAECSPGGNE